MAVMQLQQDFVQMGTSALSSYTILQRITDPFRMQHGLLTCRWQDIPFSGGGEQCYTCHCACSRECAKGETRD